MGIQISCFDSRADHNEIAQYFGLSHRGSISHPLSRIRKELSLAFGVMKLIELKNAYI